MTNRLFSISLAALMALAITGCGSKDSSQTAEQPAAPSAAPAGKTVDASTAGSVSGKVSLDGKARARKKPST